MALLFENGATGVHDMREDGGGLLTHFSSETDTTALTRALADAGARVEVASVGSTDWSVQWRSSVHAHRVGRLTVAPPWLAGSYDRPHTVIVDPGMAFGTGGHPSTRGALRLMQQVVRPGDIVADLGAGSGVLAIAAAKLGAARVAAVELDPDAIGNAESNVEQNGVAERVRVIQGDAMLLLPLLAPLQVVLANILAPVIMELLPAMRGALSRGGRAVLAGVVLDERPAMLDAIERTGWVIACEDIDAGSVVPGLDGETSWWSAVVAPS
jgi:ribosomal protein L11 methyltransferase